MTDIEAHARRLLDLARTGHGPTSADVLRVRKRLHARVLATPALFAPTTAGALTTTGKGMLAKVGLWLGLGASIGGVVGVGATLIQTASSRPREAVAALAAPRSLAPSALVAGQPTAQVALAQAAPAAPPELRLPNEAGQPIRAAGSARSLAAEVEGRAALEGSTLAPDLRREIAGLRRAEQALHAGQPAQAIALLDEIDRTVGTGSMAEERTAVRVIARCALGQGASAELEAFFQRYSGSVHAARVQAACNHAASNFQTETGGSPHQ